MFHVRRTANELTPRRLDANFYSPAFTENHRTVSRLKNKPLDALRDKNSPIVYGILKPEGSSNGRYRVVKAENFDGMFVDPIKCDEVSQNLYTEFSRSIAVTGDVLIAIGGYVGRPAILQHAEGISSNINRHLARLRVDRTHIDSHYLVVVLSSKHGQLLLNRQITGTVQAGINLAELREVEVPIVLPSSQKYIGDKVRQAERLRTWAKATESFVNRYHQALVPLQSTLNFSKRVRLVSPARMSERLDAHFYPGVVDEYLRLHQGKFKSLGKFCTAIYNGQTQPEAENSISCKQITVTNLSSSFLAGEPRDVEIPPKKEKFLKPYDVLMCNAAHNKTYIGKDLTFVHSDAAILPSTEVMTIRVDRDQLPASYVRAYLLTKLGYVQIQSTIRGITAHSYPDDMALLDIYIPKLASEYKEEWFACDQRLALAGKACEAATNLTNAAKFLVEALIEDQLDEAQFVAAEQALQSDNDQLDRSILMRVKTDGLDGQGQALFADLDELYRLLAQAEEF